MHVTTHRGIRFEAEGLRRVNTMRNVCKAIAWGSITHFSYFYSKGVSIDKILARVFIATAFCPS